MIQRMVSNRDFYREAAIKIPRPRFIVLYNGTKEMPDFWTINLSDNFMGEDEETSLQLTVEEYNINNECITERCSYALMSPARGRRFARYVL